MRLATGVVARSEARYVALQLEFSDHKFQSRFVVIDMDDRYDLILGIKWLREHEPWIDWKTGEVKSSAPAQDERWWAGGFPEHGSAWRDRLDGLRKCAALRIGSEAEIGQQATPSALSEIGRAHV